MLSHLKHENDFIHAAIEARQPGGARRTAEDHVEHIESILVLHAEIGALRQAPADQRPTLAMRLYRHLALFVAENLQHMHIEETANNAALWSLYSDTELRALHARLVATIGPRELLDTARWMAGSLNPQELAAVLGGLQREAPPEAFRVVLDQVRPQLSEARWAKLGVALNLPFAVKEAA
jgi:hypothetical protein